jgi:hypothetical protein
LNLTWLVPEEAPRAKYSGLHISLRFLLGNFFLRLNQIKIDLKLNSVSSAKQLRRSGFEVHDLVKSSCYHHQQCASSCKQLHYSKKQGIVRGYGEATPVFKPAGLTVCSFILSLSHSRSFELFILNF